MLASVHAMQAQSITYTRIASGSTTVPGSAGTFSGFGEISLDGNNVAFVGLSNNNSTTGIYTSTISGLSLSKVVDSTTIPTDNGTPLTANGAFSYLVNPTISGTNIAFRGVTNNGNTTAIYTGSLGTVGASLIVLPNDPAPEASTKYSTPFAPVVSGSKLLFLSNFSDDGSGNGHAGGGIYLATVGQHATSSIGILAERPGTLPGHTISGFGSSVSLDGNMATFRASYSGGSAVYLANTTTNSLTLIADSSTPLPSGTGTFSAIALASPVVSGTNVAFSTNQGVYLKDATGLHTIADNTTFVPGLSGVQFNSGGFSPGISLDGGNVAFTAAYSGGIGLFEEYNGTLYAIATVSGQNLPSDSLFGDPTFFFQITNEAVDGNHIAFQYTVNGSTGQQGVAVATIGASVPEPSVGISLLGGLGLFAMGRRRRQQA